MRRGFRHLLLNDLWGINPYPELEGDAFVEFDSMINLRPSQGNRSRSVEDGAIRARGRADYSERAFERALELLDLTVADSKNQTRLRELLRVREALADYFVFDNSYHSSAEAWQRYFRFFLLAARGNR